MIMKNPEWTLVDIFADEGISGTQTKNRKDFMRMMKMSNGMRKVGIDLRRKLFASVLKRQNGIKDYGKLFPGHGGVMDRFDSVAAIALLLFTVVQFWSPIL